MVHSAVGVDDGVLHEAAVLVDLLLGDLRWRRFRNIQPSSRGVGGRIDGACAQRAPRCSTRAEVRGGGVKAALQVLRLSKKWRTGRF